jgi:transposase-like protein
MEVIVDAVKRVTHPMLRFTSLEAAQCTLAGIELMHMRKTRQLVIEKGNRAQRPLNSAMP